MTIHIDSAIIHDAVREAVAAHLAEHPIVMPTDNTTTQPPAVAEPKYLTRKEAAEMGRMSLPTLHALVNEGRIHPIKVGSRTLIPADEFRRDLAAGKFSNNRHRRGL